MRTLFAAVILVLALGQVAGAQEPVDRALMTFHGIECAGFYGRSGQADRERALASWTSQYGADIPLADILSADQNRPVKQPLSAKHCEDIYRFFSLQKLH